jgi:hypothetical protein
MSDRMTNIKQVVDNYIGLSEREQLLLFTLRDALRAVTTGDHVSRAYNCQQVLEDGLARYEVSDD